MGNSQSSTGENILITRRSVTVNSDAIPKEKQSIPPKDSSSRPTLSTSISQPVISTSISPPAPVISSGIHIASSSSSPSAPHISTLPASVSHQLPTDSNAARSGLRTSDGGGVGASVRAKTNSGADVGASLPYKRHSLDLPLPQHPFHANQRAIARSSSWRHSGERARPKSHEKMKEKLRKVGDRNLLNKSQDNTTRADQTQPGTTTHPQLTRPDAPKSASHTSPNIQLTSTVQLCTTRQQNHAPQLQSDTTTKSNKTRQPEKISQHDKNAEKPIETDKKEKGRNTEDGKKIEERRKLKEGKLEEMQKVAEGKRVEGGMSDLGANVGVRGRSRGYTHVGFSAFVQDLPPPPIDKRLQCVEKKDTPPPSPPLGKRLQHLISPTVKGLPDDGRGKGLWGIAGGTRQELGSRPRSNSLAGFGVGVDDSVSASSIIAALKRASQRIEQNLKSKLSKPKISVVLTVEARAAMTIQATFRMWVSVKRYKSHVQRASVIREILITELDYVRFLSVLVKVYYYPLRKANIVTQEEINAIFPQVEIIKIYNSKFVELLQKKMRGWNIYQTIGDVFLSMVDVMREPYAIYISQFPDISATITSCSRRPPVAQFLQKCTKFTEVASMDLLSLVSMPFQRIPRYILLLKECLKFTSPDHRDYELIRIAIKKLDSLTQVASERLRMTESSKSVVKISAMCVPPVENLVRPYRKLLRDGFIDAQFIPTRGKEKDHPQVKSSRLFLFTDCLLVAQTIKKSFFAVSSEQKLKPIAVLDLHGAVLVDIAQPVNEFRLRVQIGIAIFHTKNWPEKEAWKSDILEAIHVLAEESHIIHQPENLARSSSVNLETPANRVKLVRTHSQISNPPPTQEKKRKPPPRGLTRQFTIPQIAMEMFAPQKLAAPKEQRSTRIFIGRAASYKSFFLRPDTTHRKHKEPSSLLIFTQNLRKTQSLTSVCVCPTTLH